MGATDDVELRAKLSGARWPLFKNATIDVDGTMLAVEILRPPRYVIVTAIRAAKAAGEIDEKDQPIGEVEHYRFIARMVALCLFAPGGSALFDSDHDIEVLVRTSWLLSLQEDVTAAVADTGVVGTKLH